jgi:hypothetical protein
VGEALIREAWPTVLGLNAPLALLAKKVMQTYFLAPIGFLLLLPLFVRRISPFLSRRYAVTNRRVMIQGGLKPVPMQEVALADIDEVRIDAAGVDPFYLSGNLEILSKGQVVLRLAGVPEPEGFRLAIMNACRAWAGRSFGPFISSGAAGQGEAAKA